MILLLVFVYSSNNHIEENSLYYLEDNPDCYELCKNCTEKSSDSYAQKCTSCIDSFILNGQNCECENGKQKSGKTCKECQNHCKSYQKN